jgi:interferon, gamma-inducible protein 30
MPLIMSAKSTSVFTWCGSKVPLSVPVSQSDTTAPSSLFDWPPMSTITALQESYCPDCQDFISSALTTTMAAAGVMEVMNFTMVPYGNAKTSKWTGKITCQHGEQECVGNMIETCIIHHNPGVHKYFPAIQCMEHTGGSPVDQAEKCCKSNNIDWDQVKTCYTGDEGKQLEKEMAAETDALSPAHTMVPWVVVNGKPLDNPDSILQSVCDAYTGTKPTGCSSLAETKTEKPERRSNLKGCDRVW